MTTVLSVQNPFFDLDKIFFRVFIQKNYKINDEYENLPASPKQFLLKKGILYNIIFGNKQVTLYFFLKEKESLYDFSGLESSRNICFSKINSGSLVDRTTDFSIV